MRAAQPYDDKTTVHGQGLASPTSDVSYASLCEQAGKSCFSHSARLEKIWRDDAGYPRSNGSAPTGRKPVCKLSDAARAAVCASQGHESYVHV